MLDSILLEGKKKALMALVPVLEIVSSSREVQSIVFLKLH